MVLVVPYDLRLVGLVFVDVIGVIEAKSFFDFVSHSFSKVPLFQDKRQIQLKLNSV